jgi:hypothetical protein
VNDSPLDSFREAAQWFVALTARIEPHAWDRPALGTWDVRSLVGHTARALSTATTYASRRAEHADHADPVSYLRWSLTADPAAIAERAAQAAAAFGDDPSSTIRALAGDALATLEKVDLEAPIATPAGTMTLAAYLPTRTLELIVHGVDIAVALDLDAAPPRRALRTVATLLLELHLTRTPPAALIRALAGRPLPPGGLALWAGAESSTPG